VGDATRSLSSLRREYTYCMDKHNSEPKCGAAMQALTACVRAAAEAAEAAV